MPDEMARCRLTRHLGPDMEKLNTLKTLIDALNGVGMQVWAIVILVIGAALVVAHQADHGSMVVGGGLALLQHKLQDQK